MNASKWTSPKRLPVASESSLLSVALAALISLGTYAVLASPETAFAIDARPDAHQTGSTIQLGNSTVSFESLVERLSESLQNEPDDAGGWMLLARAYEHQGRREEALVALDRARDLGMTNTELEIRLFFGDPSPK